MTRFDSASRAFGQALKTGQVGTPVAVRIVSGESPDHGAIERHLAIALAGACEWFESTPERIAALGSVVSGQISTLTHFAGGQTALVSAGSCGVGRPALAITVIGNRGTLDWEDDSASAVDEHDPPDLSPQAKELLGQIRQALEANQAKASQTSASPATLPWPPAKLKPLAPPYGVLLVAGRHTHQPSYAQALAADKRCKLIGLTDETDVTPERKALNAALARDLEIPLLPDLPAALTRDDVQIVSICAEPVRRGRIIAQAAAAGKHLYLDKPFAATLGDADRAVEAIRAAGVSSHMFSMATSALAERMQEWITTGTLGELAAVHLDLSFAKGHPGSAKLGTPRQETPAPDRYELPDSKRELANIGVYPLATLLMLLGRKVRRVFATTGNYFFEENVANNMEDFGQLLLEMEDGLVATISVGRTGWRSHPAGGLNRAVLVGTNQTAVLDGYRPRVEAWSDAEPWTAPARNPDDPMGMWGAPTTGPYASGPKQQWTVAARPMDDARYFLDSLQHGRASQVSAALAAHTTEVFLAGYQAAASGRAVDLPLPR